MERERESTEYAVSLRDLVYNDRKGESVAGREKRIRRMQELFRRAHPEREARVFQGLAKPVDRMPESRISNFPAVGEGSGQQGF